MSRRSVFTLIEILRLDRPSEVLYHHTIIKKTAALKKNFKFFRAKKRGWID